MAKRTITDIISITPATGFFFIGEDRKIWNDYTYPAVAVFALVSISSGEKAMVPIGVSQIDLRFTTSNINDLIGQDFDEIRDMLEDKQYGIMHANELERYSEHRKIIMKVQQEDAATISATA